MLGLILFARQFVYNNKKSETRILSARRSVRKEPAPNAANEKYEIIKTYEQDSIAERDPKFKRILFWNEVIP
jgi:hypothetical protein